MIIISVPSTFIAATLTPVTPALKQGAILLNIAKGFAPDTTEPMILALEKLAPAHPCVHLAGPCVANEFVHSQKAFIVMASSSEEAAKRTAQWFTGTYFHATTTTDVIGAALGGILKNVYAILLGCLHKLDGTSQNLMAAAMTASISEMAKIATTQGADPSTLYGLAGLGDLVATGSSSNSHNRHFGENLAAGRSVVEIQQQTAWLPEGVAAVKVACELANIAGISAPLAEWVNRSLQETPTLQGLVAALELADGSP